MVNFLTVALTTIFVIAFGSPLSTVIPITVVAFVLYYLRNVAQPPQLTVKDGQFRKFIETHLTSLQHRRWPTPWLLDSRIHTIVASIFGSFWYAPLKFRREILQMSDGGQVALDWLDAQNSREDGQHMVVIVLPGITGDSSAEYIREPLRHARAVGSTCVVFNNRGLGGLPLKTYRTYCAANCEDISVVIEHVHKLYPDSKLIGLGFSMGGMILTRYISEFGDVASQHLTAAMTVSAPWDAPKSTESLHQPANRIFTMTLANGLKETVKRERLVLAKGQPLYDIEFILKSRTIREFDDRFTAPVFGFRDVEHYYEECTLTSRVCKVRVPLIAVCACDDVFVPGNTFPLEEIAKSDMVAMVSTVTGGHLAFTEGLFGTNRFSFRIWQEFHDAVSTHADEMLWLNKVKVDEGAQQAQLNL